MMNDWNWREQEVSDIEITIDVETAGNYSKFPGSRRGGRTRGTKIIFGVVQVAADDEVGRLASPEEVATSSPTAVR